jgi:hypothetical protein
LDAFFVCVVLVGLADILAIYRFIRAIVQRCGARQFIEIGIGGIILLVLSLWTILLWIVLSISMTCVDRLQAGHTLYHLVATVNAHEPGVYPRDVYYDCYLVECDLRFIRCSSVFSLNPMEQHDIPYTTNLVFRPSALSLRYDSEKSVVCVDDGETVIKCWDVTVEE